MIALIVCAMAVSKWFSEMPFSNWYCHVLLNGVNKIAMSVTHLSCGDGGFERSCWMAVFEFYFGFCIKFINPAFLFYMIVENLAADLAQPYGSISQSPKL